jgi:hypothetical protein
MNNYSTQGRERERDLNINLILINFLILQIR